MKKIIYLLVLAGHFAFGQYTEIINSNNPGKSLGAYSVGRKVAQLELDFFYENQEHKPLVLRQYNYGGSYKLRTGIWKEQLELMVDGVFLRNIKTDKGIYTEKNYKNGFQKNTIGVKYLLYNPDYQESMYSWNANNRFNWERLIPAISIYTGANFFAKNRFLYELTNTDFQSVTPKAVVSLQSHPTSHMVLVGNIIGDNLISENRELAYILTITQHLNDSRWSFFVENEGTYSKYYSDIIFRGGLSFLISKDIQTNLWGSINTKNTPTRESLGVGLSYRFYDNHKRVEFKEKIKLLQK